jgi:hypothetical protein
MQLLQQQARHTTRYATGARLQVECMVHAHGAHTLYGSCEVGGMWLMRVLGCCTSAFNS